MCPFATHSTSSSSRANRVRSAILSGQERRSPEQYMR
jgi:hypothetical protein